MSTPPPYSDGPSGENPGFVPGNVPPPPPYGTPLSPYGDLGGNPNQGYSGVGPTQGSPGQPNAQNTPAQGGEFFGSLFDFGFKNFITLKFATAIYIVAIVLIGIGYLVGVIVGFGVGAGAGVAALIFGWIPALVYVLLVRVGLEFAVATIRTAQNTSELVAQGRSEHS